jgi:hypothetical protein
MCWRNSALEGLGHDAVRIGKESPVFRRSLRPQTSFGVPEDADRQLLRAMENYWPLDKELVQEDLILYQNNNHCENIEILQNNFM